MITKHSSPFSSSCYVSLKDLQVTATDRQSYFSCFSIFFISVLIHITFYFWYHLVFNSLILFLVYIFSVLFNFFFYFTGVNLKLVVHLFFLFSF